MFCGDAVPALGDAGGSRPNGPRVPVQVDLGLSSKWTSRTGPHGPRGEVHLDPTPRGPVAARPSGGRELAEETGDLLQPAVGVEDRDAGVGAAVSPRHLSFIETGRAR